MPNKAEMLNRNSPVLTRVQNELECESEIYLENSNGQKNSSDETSRQHNFALTVGEKIEYQI